ncbi:MAG: hypothetical protein QOE93_195 [Actinomycetota bacterium]|jgi:hypothetical protein|nr:hypothetical protein [Actinomycetota bacterium]
MSDVERVTVTVAEAGLARIDEVVERLRSEGMTVERVLGTLGLVIGSVARGRRAELAALPHVTAVEAETTFDLAPPEDEIQ